MGTSVWEMCATRRRWQRSSTTAIREKVLGPEHPTLALTLNNLADLLAETGRAGEAEGLLRRALAIVEASAGRRHPTYLAAAGNLAALLRAQGRAAEAAAFE